ncbi:MAG: dicarboxylate/amino acid:cation symporter [Desulfobacterota bacterium]|nr:dicarboxylate/amino acid:cation symporter [Thermodesulfobacteriota bacterium]MDW8002100.1 dicarboxylate/amino acid:cation symporter [Deltaproteobacteria bacterium]
MKKIGVLGWILIGFVLGIIVGAIVGKPITVIRPLGTLFINLLRMLVVPLVFSTLAVGVSTFSGRKFGRMFGKTYFFYYFTGAIAMIVALIIAGVADPGHGFPVGELKKVEVKPPPKLVDIGLAIVPTNPFESLAKGDMLPIIFFAIVLGMSMAAAGSQGESLRNVLSSLAETMYKLVGYVLWFGPIGVFALMASTVGTHGLSVLKPYAYLIFLVYLATAIQVFGVYTVLLRLFKIRPFRYLNKIKEAPLFAFTTCSSSATLPVTMKVTRAAGVSDGTTSFVLPMGATLNMDGTGMYQAICAVFLANAFGVQLSFEHYVLIGIVALLASIGTAGVPGAGLIMLGMVLGSVGIPLEGIALLAGIDRILDMARTAVNVTDDAVAAVLVGKTEKESLPEDILVTGR